MLKQRVITAIVLVILSILAMFYSSDKVWQGLMMALAFIAAWEWSRFAKISAHALRLVYAMMVTLTVNMVVLFFDFDGLLTLSIISAALMAVVVSRYQLNKGLVGLGSMGVILLAGMVVVPTFAVSMIEMRSEFSAELLLLSMLLVWAIDTGAYFSGRRFGKNKLAVHVSPGKTWEGVYGGALLSFVIAWLVLYLLNPVLTINWLFMSVLLTLIAVYSVFGDLFESVLKRQVALKDSGNILPGHGGILDRIDSLLVAVPLFYLLWHFSLQV